MFLLKNPQFLRNHNETWSKCGTHGLFIFTKFCNDCIKIVDFLIKAYFWGFLKFGAPYCTRCAIQNWTISFSWFFKEFSAYNETTVTCNTAMERKFYELSEDIFKKCENFSYEV